MKLSPKLDEIETNSQFIQAFSLNEPVLLCDYTAKLNDVEGRLSLVVSFISLEELLPKLSAEHMLKAGVSDSERLGEHRVADVSVPLIAGFPKFVLGLEQVKKIKKGDIIDVQVPVEDKVCLWANNKLLFKGKLGKRDEKRAVKIEEISHF